MLKIDIWIFLYYNRNEYLNNNNDILNEISGRIDNELFNEIIINIKLKNIQRSGRVGREKIGKIISIYDSYSNSAFFSSFLEKPIFTIF